jgi:ABC-type branched-subunit amino acid transport system permease subunit
MVFCVSAMLAGIGGAILTPITGSINSLSYHPILSLILVAVLFIAGQHPIVGALIASAMYVLIPGYISSQEVQEYIPVSFGALAIVSAVLVGRSARQRAVEKLANSTRAKERSTARSPRAERLAELELAEATV